MRAKSSNRVVCVWCPDWPVVAARRRDAALVGQPVAVCERDGGREVVRAASAEARAEGLTRGMRRREAEARCGGLVLVLADDVLEARTFEVVARTLEPVTARLVLFRPGLLAFPARGPSRYFGGDAGVAARVHEVLGPVLGGAASVVRVGIADGEFAARLAARRAAPGGSSIVPPGEAAAFLAPWPVATLGDDDLADLLVRLGVRTLGDFAALPPAAVLARFGTAVRHLHELSRGHDGVPEALDDVPPELAETLELDPPANRVDAVAFAAKVLADRLVARLEEQGRACTRVVIEAETEHGESFSRCWRHDGAFTPAALTERVRWQLDGWLGAGAAAGEAVTGGDVRARQDADALADAAPTGALTLLRLVPDEVVPLGNRQLGFWGGDATAADRAGRALARLQGMLGHDRVVTAVPQGGRTPAERMRWVPWGEPREALRPPPPSRSFPGWVTQPSPPSPPGLVTQPSQGRLRDQSREALPAWPGALPPPSPARVFDPPLPAELFDAGGRPVTVSGRGEASADPAALRCHALPGGGGPLAGWAGPWPHDVRWWDRLARRRRALWQVTVDTGTTGEVACLVAVEAGRATVEAIYD